MDEALWFTDAKKTSRYTRCDHCPSNEIRCENCSRKINGEVFLLQMTGLEQKKMFGKMFEVAVTSFTEALNYIGINAQFEIFNEKRIRYLESKYNIHVYLYQKMQYNTTHVREQYEAIREPRKLKHETVIRLMLKEPLPISSSGLIENFTIIQSKTLLPKVFTCHQMKQCKFTTSRKDKIERHEKGCRKFNTKHITCKQRAYGDDADVVREMVDNDILPKEAISYRSSFLATFDLETIEEKYDTCLPENGLMIDANLRLLSIAVGSTMEGYEPKCWVRKSSNPAEEARLVKAFLQELNNLWQEKQKKLPFWIAEAYNKIYFMNYELKKRNAKWTEYQSIWKYKMTLRKFTLLDTFGFNSAKFDIPCIAGILLTELKRTSKKVSILKKMSSYFCISTDKFIFKDVLKFSAPCSYDKFVSVWGTPGSKSIWPYSFFTSIEDIKAAKKFPPLKAFESKLRGNIKPTMESYIAAKTEFYRRKLLPRSDKNRITSMYGFLRYYNKQDVQPMAFAIKNCFDSYFTYFGVNAITAMSLPSLAQEAMFKNYAADAPLIYSFSEAFKEINQLFRKNVYGGLVNVYRRHVCTYDKEGIAKAARYADNGDPFTSIISLDFTSMYLTCQKQDMPTSPGILWERKTNTNFYKKNIMCSGHSFKGQQWLCYRQATGMLIIHSTV